MNSKPSKSARKRETQALQKLGERLIELSADQLRQIDLDAALLDAIIDAQSMRAHGALRRQKQLIGKLMRNIDPAPITTALDRLGGEQRRDKELFRQAETWRDRLTENNRDALGEFVAEIGGGVKELELAVTQWKKAPTDKARRTAQRAVFREVHKALKLQGETTKPAQSTTDSHAS